MTFEEVKKDYLELINTHGYPEDMTGGFVVEEALEKIMLNPTKKKSKKHMINVIQYGFQRGRFYNSELNGHIQITDSKVVKHIYEKYII